MFLKKGYRQRKKHNKKIKEKNKNENHDKKYTKDAKKLETKLFFEKRNMQNVEKDKTY